MLVHQGRVVAKRGAKRDVAMRNAKCCDRQNTCRIVAVELKIYTLLKTKLRILLGPCGPINGNESGESYPHAKNETVDPFAITNE